jgi:inorganic phosphate transporter, PiT family
MSFWEAVQQLGTAHAAMFLFALVVAFGFEFINGFHDTANAVTTVIYTRTLQPTPAVLFSGVMNFVGVLVGGTAVAFAVVNLLPVDLLVNANSAAALVMVMALLLAGVTWNLGTWYLGLPVSSSHTLIGSILGVGIANSLIEGNGLSGVRWDKAAEVGVGLLASPVIGFVLAALLLLAMKATIKEPKLYVPPQGDDKPPKWVRGVLIGTCGGVSFAHGSNDGQKGMGLILLVLIGFLSGHYALDVYDPAKVDAARKSVAEVKGRLAAAGLLTPELAKHADDATADLTGLKSFADLPTAKRWEVRQHLFQLSQAAKDEAFADDRTDEWRGTKKGLTGAIEFVPLWVVIGVALALGIGTTIGYKRIVVTVAEKIGKTHLTYAQGAAAEVVAAVTILAADLMHAPVSTTQVLSSGVAGTMAANKSGLQGGTAKKILLAWAFTLPCTVLLAGGLFLLGRLLVK